jgi:SAM-dependent methyltransferase
VWNALPPERERYYAAFIANYESVRAAEGRGSRNSEFYLSLPGRDLSGRNQEQWEIRDRSFQCLVDRILPLVEDSYGRPLDILDLGAGNCWLSYRLALRGDRPVAVDLLDNPFDGLGAAEHYESRVPNLFPRFKAELDALPFGDDQFDLVIFNASFHYSEDYVRTLSESLRCLRRPGCVVLVDTAWYGCEESGKRMLEERRRVFEEKFGFASDALASLEFLTDTRLKALETKFNFRWITFTPHYGLRWRMRPFIAKLRGRREPSRFRIYMAEVTK